MKHVQPQALGRLRRDGTAVFLSKHTMRLATLGRELAGAEEDSEELKLARSVRTCCLEALTFDSDTPCDDLLQLEIFSGEPNAPRAGMGL